MKKILEVIAILLVVGGAYLLFPNNEISKDKKIVAIGDSLVEGVGSENGGGFIKMLSDDLDILITNLGKSGDTTADVLERIGEVEKYNPDIIILLVGGNDFLRGVPETEIFGNLSEIIDELQKGGREVILLGLENNLPGKKYDEYYEELVENKDIEYVPNVLGRIFGVREYMADGLHPNDRGYRVIADYVRPYLERSLKP